MINNSGHLFRASVFDEELEVLHRISKYDDDDHNDNCIMTIITVVICCW